MDGKSNGVGGDGFPTPRPAVEVLRHLDQLVRTGEVAGLAALPSGFHPLDRYLSGGFRPGELILVGGAQGTGKTTMTLQMARNLVVQSQAICVYACYEHEENFLLQRLMALESFLARGKVDTETLTLNQLRDLLLAPATTSRGPGGLEGALHEHPQAIAALRQVQMYGEGLYLLKASGSSTDIASLRRVVRDLKERHGTQVVLFVDYLQKVPVFPEVSEAEAVTRVANELKDLALAESIPIVAVVAADRAGLEAQRLRIHHFRGSSSLSYESDVVLVLNNKYRVVAKKSITFNYHQAQDFRNWVVCTIEKNRSGRDLVDLEFRAQFPCAAFEPTGRVVAEALLEERIQEE